MPTEWNICMTTFGGRERISKERQRLSCSTTSRTIWRVWACLKRTHSLRINEEGKSRWQLANPVLSIRLYAVGPAHNIHGVHTTKLQIIALWVNNTLYCCPQLQQMFTDFHNSFSIRFGSKYEMNWSLNIPSHLKTMTTLPCETLRSQN